MPDSSHSLPIDHTSGSHVVSSQAMNHLETLVSGFSGDDPDLLVDLVNTAGKKLIKLYPNLVSVRKRVTATTYYLKRLTKSNKSVSEIKNLTLTKMTELEQLASVRQAKIATLGAKLIFNHNKILAISYSATIRSIIFSAKQMKRKFELYCLESRPLNEGSIFADEMASIGVPVTLITDAAMGRIIPDMNMFLVGADRLMESGFVNKIGTLPAAVLSNNFKVPVYLACDSEKILSETERAVRFYSQQPDEIFATKNKHLKVENFYFEQIPYRYVDRVVTEDGIFETQEYINWYFHG